MTLRGAVRTLELMRFLRWLLRTPRALGALLLLATLVTGEVADARHHLAPEGCSSEHHGGRADHCTCAALHAITLGVDLAASPAPAVEESMFAPVAGAIAFRERRGAQAAPRAPPRG